MWNWVTTYFLPYMLARVDAVYQISGFLLCQEVWNVCPWFYCLLQICTVDRNGGWYKVWQYKLWQQWFGLLADKLQRQTCMQSSNDYQQALLSFWKWISKLNQFVKLESNWVQIKKWLLKPKLWHCGQLRQWDGASSWLPKEGSHDVCINSLTLNICHAGCTFYSLYGLLKACVWQAAVIQQFQCSKNQASRCWCQKTRKLEAWALRCSLSPLIHFPSIFQSISHYHWLSMIFKIDRKTTRISLDEQHW